MKNSLFLLVLLILMFTSACVVKDDDGMVIPEPEVTGGDPKTKRWG